MRYLIDSNVLLEVALRRRYASDASTFLAATKSTDLAVADFSLHGLGFYLGRKTPEIFDGIIADVIARSITVVRLDVADLPRVTATAARVRLDFDDAFLYTISEIHDLTIVSFDADFDRTPRGRKTPAQVTTGP